MKECKMDSLNVDMFSSTTSTYKHAKECLIDLNQFFEFKIDNNKLITRGRVYKLVAVFSCSYPHSNIFYILK